MKSGLVLLMTVSKEVKHGDDNQHSPRRNKIGSLPQKEKHLETTEEKTSIDTSDVIENSYFYREEEKRSLN